ncbi:MAG TPA: hypothetical protein DCQ06_13780, partial [Myxococcales bacterium]|nr:hypothetical protein [Myxococcales bacterium]
MKMRRQAYAWSLSLVVLVCSGTPFSATSLEWEGSTTRGRIGAYLLSTTMAGITPASGQVARG